MDLSGKWLISIGNIVNISYNIYYIKTLKSNLPNYIPPPYFFYTQNRCKLHSWICVSLLLRFGGFSHCFLFVMRLVHENPSSQIQPRFAQRASPYSQPRNTLKRLRRHGKRLRCPQGVRRSFSCGFRCPARRRRKPRLTKKIILPLELKAWIWYTVRHCNSSFARGVLWASSGRVAMFLDRAKEGGVAITSNFRSQT